ncbi:MAG: TonB-dependent receptor [Planctomycetota bacterium]
MRRPAGALWIILILPLAVGPMLVYAEDAPHEPNDSGKGKAGVPKEKEEPEAKVPPPEESPAGKTPQGPAKEVQLPDVNVTAARSQRRPLDLPYATAQLDLDELAGVRLRSLPESMAEFPGVLAQKTGHGQGSPIIRGFTGFHTLLLIDGVRLNNSVFRSGPNQYWNTVDPYSLERMELVRGPSSVLYGSDAVGGTVNAIPLSPVVPAEGSVTRPRLLYRFASAEASHLCRAEFEAAQSPTGGILAGFTAKTFGDLVGGSHVGTMEKTGYREFDGDVKGVWRVTEDFTVTAAVQHVAIDDAWRTHKTVYGIPWHGTTVGNEKKRPLDQQRDLGYLQAEWKQKKGFLRRVSASLSYHYQQEDRDRVKSSDERDQQGFDVGTLGFWAVAEAQSPVGRISAGLENYYDVVNSFARKYNADGSLRSVEIQGPVGDNATYNLFGAFVQDELSLGSFLEITGGVRFTWASVFAEEVEDPVTGNPIEVKDRWTQFCGSLRVLAKPVKEIGLFAGVSQGFRAPNLSDLTRLDSARSNEIETPSPDLDPETFISFEIGAKADRKPVRAQAAFYYTLIQNGIVRYPTGLMIGTEYEVTKANVGDGFVYGIELQAEMDLGSGFRTRGGFSWMEGMQDTYDVNRVLVRDWMSRVAPMMGRLKLRWENEKKTLWLEGEAVLAGKAEKLSLRDQGDTQRIPPGGTPGYGLLHVRLGARASEHLSFFVSAENILNKDYRVHGSGLNGPGTSLILGVEIR